MKSLITLTKTWRRFLPIPLVNSAPPPDQILARSRPKQELSVCKGQRRTDLSMLGTCAPKTIGGRPRWLNAGMPHAGCLCAG